MKKYNIQNYLRYKEDVKTSIANLEGLMWDEYNTDELIIKFLPLVENLARKFSTSDQASGVLSINDLIQCGSEGLTKAVNKIDWEVLNASEDIEKTLKSFLSKRIKGAIRRRIDMARGNIRIPEHKLNAIRKNPNDKKLSGRPRIIVEIWNEEIKQKILDAYKEGQSDVAAIVILDIARETFYKLVRADRENLGTTKYFLHFSSNSSI